MAKDETIDYTKDAVFVMKADGTQFVAIPDAPEDSDAPDHFVKAATLAWIVNKPELLKKLQKQFEREVAQDKD